MRLPSLNALRAFEAAARHESFARAAQELCVSEGAVSRHIKLLEEELGVQLFRRLTRKVELTDYGRQLMPIVGRAFADIALGAMRITSAKADLKVVSSQSLSIRWLVPRLERLRAMDMGFYAQVTTKIYGLEEILSGQFDLALICSLDSVPKGIKAKHFLPLALTPACSPRLLKRGPPLKRPRDLSPYALLHTWIDHLDWKLWADAFGNGEVDIERGECFSDRDTALRAAVMGAGVVIGDLTLMQDELAKGELVTPFPDLVFCSEAANYYVVAREEMWSDPRVIKFYNWLVEERDGATPARQTAAQAFAAE